MIGLSSGSNKRRVSFAFFEAACSAFSLRYTMLKGTLASASVVVSSDVAYILELRHSLNLKQDPFYDKLRQRG